MDRNNKLLFIVTTGICVALTVVFGVIYAFSGLNEKKPVTSPKPMVIENNKEKEQEPQKIESRVSFTCVGDNIIHDAVRRDAKNKAIGKENEFDFLPMYENVKPLIQNSDLSFVNQEAPIAGKDLGGYSGYPNFNAPEQAVYDLQACGFNVFNLANNHMLDKGTNGYKNTIGFFNSLEGITHIGGYENKEDYENIRIVEKNGVKIAFLSYTYSTNGYTLVSNSEMVVPYTNDDEIARQTKSAREMADFVVVSVHWGVENSHNANNEQKRQMQIMVDNNVDVILGTHPHVLQPVEWQDRPDGKKTLVMYSIGNFLSNMEKMAHHVGAIASLDFVKDDEETRIENVSIIPTLCHFETDGADNMDYSVLRLSEYSPELLEKHARQNTGTDSKRDMDYLYDIVRNNIPNEFLTEDFYRNY